MKRLRILLYCRRNKHRWQTNYIEINHIFKTVTYWKRCLDCGSTSREVCWLSEFKFYGGYHG
jgi:hypothetical protein